MRNSDKAPLIPDEISRILLGRGAGTGSEVLDRLTRMSAAMQAMEWQMIRQKRPTSNGPQASRPTSI